jgi:hypothetical protein
MLTLTVRKVSPTATEIESEPSVCVLAVGRPMARVKPGVTALEALQEAGVGPPSPHQSLRVASGQTSEEVRDPKSRILSPGERVLLVNKVVGG